MVLALVAVAADYGVGRQYRTTLSTPGGPARQFPEPTRRTGRLAGAALHVTACPLYRLAGQATVGFFSKGPATSMMLPGGAGRIDRRLIDRSAYERLSEKSLTSLQRSPPGRPKARFQSISTAIYTPNLRSERYSHPFSDSL